MSDDTPGVQVRLVVHVIGSFGVTEDGEAGSTVAILISLSLPYDVEEASEYIEMLWKNPKLYREFSQAAIINSQTKYSISKEVELLQSLYQSLTNS